MRNSPKPRAAQKTDFLQWEAMNLADSRHSPKAREQLCRNPGESPSDERRRLRICSGNHDERSHL